MLFTTLEAIAPVLECLCHEGAELGLKLKKFNLLRTT